MSNRVIINGVNVGDKPLTKGQITYLGERLSTVGKEVIREHKSREFTIKVFRGKGYVGIGVVNQKTGNFSLCFLFHTVMDKKYFEEPKIPTKLRHTVHLKKMETWAQLKPLLKGSLNRHIKEEYFPLGELNIVTMSQGDFTKLTKKKGIRLFEINPYNSDEKLYRTPLVVSDKVQDIVKVINRGKMKFIAIPSMDVLWNRKNLKMVLDLGSRVQATYGTIIDGSTGKPVFRY